MRLKEILYRLGLYSKRLKDTGEVTNSRWREAQARAARNQMEHYKKLAMEFGSGLPIFMFTYKLGGQIWRELYQAESQEEAQAAILLHHSNDGDFELLSSENPPIGMYLRKPTKI